MGGIKDRAILAVSWYAFAHAVLIAIAVALALLGDEGLVEAIKPYVRMTPLAPDVFAFGLSPAIWGVLWLLTGKPRFLPWRH